MTLYLAAEAGILDLSLSFLAEVIAFIAMILILGRWVYPRVMAAAEARQRQIGEQLAAAERARAEAEQRLRDAEGRIQEARQQAAEIIEGAGRSGEQLRTELRTRAEEEARRITESARRDIEAERQKAIDSVRAEVADLVVVATEKVVGETLDDQRHRKLIAEAIAQVAADSRN
ncbi:MAG TPA: F0F1 ATP synthase subunit B [Candidatus Dormibacteraeota bacterium]|nr:F0F1 ATP synthase subunit B [Candidatus Dormibacteraeota bacterium]